MPTCPRCKLKNLEAALSCVHCGLKSGEDPTTARAVESSGGEERSHDVPSDRAPASKVLQGVGLAVLSAVVAIASTILLTAGANRQAKRDMVAIEAQVAADALAQYRIAKANGSAMDACVSAQFLSAACLQAKDEDLYRKAKEIERAECHRAGLPQ